MSPHPLKRVNKTHSEIYTFIYLTIKRENFHKPGYNNLYFIYWSVASGKVLKMALFGSTVYPSLVTAYKKSNNPNFNIFQVHFCMDVLLYKF